MFLLKGNAQDTLMIREAIETALKNNYTIIIAHNDALIAKKNNTPGNAGFLPDVSANFVQTNNINDTKQQFFSGEIREGSNVKANSLNANIQMNWTVFDGLSMFTNQERLKEFELIGELNARIQIENTVSQVITTYYNIVQQQRRIEALKNVIEISSERKRIAEEKLRIGSGSGLESLQATVDLNTDSSALLRQEYNTIIFKSALNELLSRAPETSFSVSDKIPMEENLKYEELSQKVAEQNPEVLLARRNTNIAALNLKQTRSSYLPSISLNSGYNFSNSESELGLLRVSQNKGINYGLTASWTLFNGFNNRRIRQVTQIELYNQETVQQQAELGIKSDFYRIYTYYITSISLLKIENRNLQVAEQNLLVATERMRLGTINALELREAQRNLIDAEFRLITAEYEAKLAETELLRLSGQLMK